MICLLMGKKEERNFQCFSYLLNEGEKSQRAISEDFHNRSLLKKNKRIALSRPQRLEREETRYQTKTPGSLIPAGQRMGLKNHREKK